MHVLLLFSTPRPLTTALGAPWRHLGRPSAGPMLCFRLQRFREGARPRWGPQARGSLPRPPLHARIPSSGSWPGWLNLPPTDHVPTQPIFIPVPAPSTTANEAIRCCCYSRRGCRPSLPHAERQSARARAATSSTSCLYTRAHVSPSAQCPQPAPLRVLEELNFRGKRRGWICWVA